MVVVGIVVVVVIGKAGDSAVQVVIVGKTILQFKWELVLLGCSQISLTLIYLLFIVMGYLCCGEVG